MWQLPESEPPAGCPLPGWDFTFWAKTVLAALRPFHFTGRITLWLMNVNLTVDIPEASMLHSPMAT